MKNCYIYVRSNGQKENNEVYLINHIQQLVEVAYKNNFQVKHIFFDPRSPGTGLQGKPQLSELMEKVINDPVQAVFVFDLSRVSRTVEACTVFTDILKLAGAELIVITGESKTREAK